VGNGCKVYVWAEAERLLAGRARLTTITMLFGYSTPAKDTLHRAGVELSVARLSYGHLLPVLTFSQSGQGCGV